MGSPSPSVFVGRKVPGWVVQTRRPPYDQRTGLEKGNAIASALSGKSGAAAGRRIEVTGSMVIGREEADITIEDAEISRRHAEVRPSGDGIEVEDLGSTNGTFVNGERISAARTLAPGDVVRVGQSELELEADSPAKGGTAIAASPGGGTSLSESPTSSSPSDQDQTLAEPTTPAGAGVAGTAGTSGGAPPSVESWSPAPTGAGAGGPSAPPAAAYTPPPTGGGYQPPPSGGYGPPQGGQGYSGGPAGPGYGSGQGGYGSGQGGYGAGADSSKGGKKGALIAGLLVLLLLIAAVAGYFLFLKSDPEEEVRSAITEFGENFGNPEVCDMVTQNFIETAYGQTGEAAVDACRTDIEAQDQDPVDIEVTSVEVNGDRATAQVEAEGETGTFELVNEDGEWLIDSAV